LVCEHSVLGDFISKISTGKTPPKSSPKYYDYSDVRWFKPVDIGKEIFLNKTDSYISNIAVSDKKATLFEKETLLITCIGDIGRIGILSDNSSSNQQITGVLTNDQLLPEFAYLYLASHRENFTDSDVLKTTLPIINQKKIRSIPIKVPSIELQKAVVKYYFSYIEIGLPFDLPSELKKYRKQLIDFAKLVDSSKVFSINIKQELTHQQTLLNKLRQQILQEAIEGKLTADWRQQNQDVEPASELLARIQAEKEQLIKDKKIKKQKPLPPISEEEKPFELPEGWIWIKIGEITNVVTSGSRNWKSLYSESGASFIRSQDIKLDRLCYANRVYVNVKKGKEGTRTFVKQHDWLIIITGANVGKCAYLYGDPGEGYVSQHVGLLRPTTKDIGKFGHLWLIAELGGRGLLSTFIYGDKPGLNLPQLRNLPFPMEQKAIVAKVAKLFTLCDQLETQITNNQTHAEQLMQAVLKEAFTQNNKPQRATAHA